MRGQSSEIFLCSHGRCSCYSFSLTEDVQLRVASASVDLFVVNFYETA